MSRRVTAEGVRLRRSTSNFVHTPWAARLLLMVRSWVSSVNDRWMTRQVELLGTESRCKHLRSR
jgi:hypothetical protein